MNKNAMNRYAVWAALLLGTAVGAYAVPVTFQVDMGFQIGLGSFNADGSDHVEVQSGFNLTGGWAGHELTNVPSTTLYQNTFDITSPAPGNVVEYKFHTWGVHDVWENLSWYPNGNRRFTLANFTQAVPSAYFADAWAGSPGTEVTFQVDMSAQVGAGNFDTALDHVEAQGAMNGSWSALTLTNDPAGANPYLFSQTYLEVGRAPGTRVEYKFHTYGSHDVWESIVGYPDNNRSFIVSNASPQVLPSVFFSDVSGYPIQAAIYFQLDMSSQILVGAFDPVHDLASIRCDALGWANPPTNGLQLFADSARPGIYTNTYRTASQLTGAAFLYKNSFYRTNTDYAVWEDGANKSVTFTGTEPLDPSGYHLISVGPTLFNGFQANTNDYLPADTVVTFTVSMTNAQSYSGFSPAIVFDQSMGVAVNGNWIPWWNWNAAAPSQYSLTNGTSGDWLYSQTVLIPKGKLVKLVYKYGIDNMVDSLNNEAPDGSDRVRYIRRTGSYTLPLDTFGTQTVEASFGDLTVGAPSGGAVPVSWLGRPGVFLQASSSVNNPGSWVTLYETAGYSSPSGMYSTNYPTAAGPTFFRLVGPAQ